MPLFSPPLKPEIDATLELSRADDIPADALFDRVYVDKERLGSQIRRLLQRRTQITLAEVAAAHPLEHGLAELVAYLSLASDDPAAIIDEERRERIEDGSPCVSKRQKKLRALHRPRHQRRPRRVLSRFAMLISNGVTCVKSRLSYCLVSGRVSMSARRTPLLPFSHSRVGSG